MRCLLLACGSSLLAMTLFHPRSRAPVHAQASFDKAVSGLSTNYLFSLSIDPTTPRPLRPSTAARPPASFWVATNPTLCTGPISLEWQRCFSCFSPTFGPKSDELVD
jgi:hypothetical protein